MTHRCLTPLLVAGLVACALATPTHPLAAAPAARTVLDASLQQRARGATSGSVRVIIRVTAGAALPAALHPYMRGPRLALIDGYVLDMPERALSMLDSLPDVESAHEDRPVWATDVISAETVGAVEVQRSGLSGEGVTVAVIDSGIATWHDDLTVEGPRPPTWGNQRVAAFVDLVQGWETPYDDEGHGSHVAGIIAGNGVDSAGRQVGIAPAASLVVLKVLDAQGQGSISQVIAALDWVATHGSRHHIRVVNLSVGAEVTGSAWTDPLALAARRVTERGIIVVAAAGNARPGPDGHAPRGSVLSPGDAPWVLTVGASNSAGTVTRADDRLAPWSAAGPTAGDTLAKPDLLAPGVAVLSLAAPGSALVLASPDRLVPGTVATATPPYLVLSGTSMAAPQVAGAVALMLEAAPTLTPNLVKALLQYSAVPLPTTTIDQQGAGVLNVSGAVALARETTRTSIVGVAADPAWSRSIIWGTRHVTGAGIETRAQAYSRQTVWGTGTSANIVWGLRTADNIVWGLSEP